MNWLLINHSNTLHGAERVLLATAKALVQRGDRVTVVVPCANEERDFEAALPAGSRVIRVPMKAAGNSLLRTLVVMLYNLPTAIRLSRFCRHEGVDAIYTGTYIMAIGAQVATMAGLPLYWHWHEEPTPDFFWSSAMSGLYRRLVKRARLIFISVRQKAAWEKALGRALNGEVVYNPIREVRAERMAHEGLTFGYLGNFEPRKNVGMLQDAFAILHAENPDTRLLLWGAPSSSSDPEKGVRIVAHNPNVVPFYAEVDVLVLPSLHETMPLVVLEAMQNGVAVLLTKESGLTELVVDGEHVLLFDPRNRNELLQQMRKMLCSEVRKKMADAGKRRAEEIKQTNNYKEKIIAQLCK